MLNSDLIGTVLIFSRLLNTFVIPRCFGPRGNCKFPWVMLIAGFRLLMREQSEHTLLSPLPLGGHGSSDGLKIPVQLCPILGQPAFRPFNPRSVQVAYQFPKLGRMVHMAPMRQFVHDDIAHNFPWRQCQSP